MALFFAPNNQSSNYFYLIFSIFKIKLFNIMAGFYFYRFTYISLLKSNLSYFLLQVMALVVGMFLICWMPWTVSVLFIYYGNNQMPSEGRTLLTQLAFFNSLANPFIYIWSIREFRSTFKRIFLRHNQAVTVGPMHVVLGSTVCSNNASEKM